MLNSYTKLKYQMEIMTKDIATSNTNDKNKLKYKTGIPNSFTRLIYQTQITIKITNKILKS